MEIGINNQTEFKIDKRLIRKAAAAAMRAENAGSREISIVFLEKKEIRKLNKQYRKLDKATDVLSFEGEGDFLGEIAVSPEVVKQRSGGDFDGALAHVLIHGVLHLAGYDHIKIQDRKIMRAREKSILQIVC